MLSHSAEFQWTFLVMHAWELVNAAAWRYGLWCTCPGENVRCEHITAMVTAGARLLRASGQEAKDEVDWQAVNDIEWCEFLRVSVYPVMEQDVLGVE